MTPSDNKDIDVQETSLLRQGYGRRRGKLLEILLKDHSGQGNIIWATDSYEKIDIKFKKFKSNKPILSELVTGEFNQLIQPRAVKSAEEQRRRTKDKAEVFTPLKIVEKMNLEIDRSIAEGLGDGHTWKDYVKLLKLEITCGEAPYIATRYDPTKSATSTLPIDKRKGFLDDKLRVVSKNCKADDEWFAWTLIAYKSSYGYEWQGDNVLIARENLLYTFYDYYKYKFKTHKLPPFEWRKEIANVISWNIWQMDGLKYVTPMSCTLMGRTGQSQSLFDEYPVEKEPCPGCRLNNPNEHTGRYAVIKDWSRGGKYGRKVRFVDLLNPQKR